MKIKRVILAHPKFIIVLALLALTGIVLAFVLIFQSPSSPVTEFRLKGLGLDVPIVESESSAFSEVSSAGDFVHHRLSGNGYYIDVKWSLEPEPVDILDYLQGIVLRAPYGTEVVNPPEVWENSPLSGGFISLAYSGENIEYKAVQRGTDFFSVVSYTQSGLSEDVISEVRSILENWTIDGKGIAEP